MVHPIDLARRKAAAPKKMVAPAKAPNQHRVDCKELACKKLRKPTSNFCPKCQAVFIGKRLRPRAAGRKAAATRARRQNMRNALAESPLRAYNPAFEERVRTGYEQ